MNSEDQMTASAEIPPPPPPRPDENLIGEIEKPRARTSAASDLSDRGHRPAFGERLVTPTFCSAYDGDTGLRCLREKGHEPPHRCEIEWEDDDDD